MAVKGSLSDISLTNLVQMNTQSNTSGRILIINAEKNASIYLSDGEIVHAELGDLSGREALFEALGWETGEFELDTGLGSPTRTINGHWSDLLLEGMKRLDESNAPENLDDISQDIPDDLGELFGLEKIENNTTEDLMAQNMQEILGELAGDAPGLFAAAVVGMDGLPIADFSRQSVNTENFSAQMTLLLKLVDITEKKLGADEVEDYLLTTDKAYLLIRFLENSDYYLGLGVARNKSNLGKVRLYSRIYAERLSQALPR